MPDRSPYDDTIEVDGYERKIEVKRYGRRPVGSARTLVAVLASPPMTSGRQTVSRLDMAARHLNCDSVRIVNLLAERTIDVREIDVVGAIEDPWLAARPAISSALAEATLTLLAFGLTEPTGVARTYFRAQIRWLQDEIIRNGLSEVIAFGGKPRHPSRWQRLTARETNTMDFEARCRGHYHRIEDEWWARN